MTGNSAACSDSVTRVWLVRCLCNGLVGKLPSMGRVALLACVGGLAFVVCAFAGFLP